MVHTLESKIGILESEVARLLDAEASDFLLGSWYIDRKLTFDTQTKSRTASGVETKSMMDVAPFIHTSSPIRSADEDAPVSLVCVIGGKKIDKTRFGLKSQNDDPTAPVRPAPYSIDSSIRPRIAIQRAPDPPAASISGPSGAKPEPLRPTGRPNFARLDTDGSDDIIEDGSFSPPTKLGKRDRLEPTKEEHSATRKTRSVSLVESFCM